MSLPEQEINHILAAISLTIGQSFDVETVLQTAVRELCKLLKCDRVLVYRFDRDWTGIVKVEAVSDPQWSILGNTIRDSCFELLWTEKYQQGEVTYYDDVTRANIDRCHREFLESFQVKANLVAPILQYQTTSAIDALTERENNNSVSSERDLPSREIRDNSIVWGLLIAHQCDRPRVWKESEVNLFQQLTDYVAIAIRQADLLQRTYQELRERKLAERKTQEIRKFLQTAIDRLPIAVYVKDARPENFGKFQLWNKATEKIFEIEAPQAIGKTAYDYFPLEQAQHFLEEDLAVLEQKEILDLPENYLQNGDSAPKIIHKVKVPIYDDDLKPQHLLCIAEDITERKNAERELKHQSEELTAFSNNLKLLHRLNTTDYQSFEALFRDHLLTGCEMFHCSTGVVGIVKEDIYTIYAIESNLIGLYPKMQLPLKDTYCYQVVERRQTIACDCVGEAKDLCSHPLYKQLKFESYIGTPIFVDGLVFGTLSFADLEVRKRPFSDREKETIEMMAQSIGRFISAHRVEQKRQEAEALLTQTKKELEIRVLQRTAELEIANHRLQEELHERKQIQFALQASQDNFRESERRWRSLLENVRLLVVGIDSRGNIDYINPYFLELTGYAYDEVINQNWFDRFVYARDREKALKIHRDIAGVNFSYSHQYHQTKIVTKSGEIKTIAWNTTQLRNLQSIPIGMMCIGKDITESQAIEKMKDEFLSVVSHELRTPLTSIRGSLGLLATGVLNEQTEKRARIVQIATESTEHLVRLVDEILELERLESDKIELVIERIQVRDAIEQALNRVQMVANKQKIKLQATEFDGYFYGDRDRIVQVLTNLLSNAIKFSPPRSTVWLDTKRETDPQQPDKSLIVFIVRDRGRGIPQDKIDSIFERFYQVDASDSRGKGGTGLGLAICRSIVEQHQGKIWVDSVYGEGSTFYFQMPIS